MTVTIIQGDMREVCPALPAGSFDCIIADPPYGETSLEWDRWVSDWPSRVLPLLKPSGSMWVFGSQRMFVENASDFAGWRIVQDVVWEKHNGSGFIADRFKRVHEIAVQFIPARIKWRDVWKCPQYTSDATARTVRRKTPPTHTGSIGGGHYVSHDGGPRLMRSVIYCRSEHGRAVHPTQKPVAVLLPLLAYSCPKGGSVIDPFAGSGSVGLAAKEYGCDATLVEASDEYVCAIRRRIEPDAPLLAETAA